MKKKKKESKWNLFIFIPCIIGGMAIAFAGAYHIQSISDIKTIGLLGWIYQIGLCAAVIMMGLKGFNSSIEELKKVF